MTARMLGFTGGTADGEARRRVAAFEKWAHAQDSEIAELEADVSRLTAAVESLRGG